MPSSSLSLDARAIYSVLPVDGTALGNIYLRTQFGWDEVHYTKVRAELEAEGLVVRGRGRGGGLARVKEAPKPKGEG
jgi:hypothetical protein